MEKSYNPQEIEKKAQDFWNDNKTFIAEDNSDKETFYCLSMFAYPSGNLHMGHVRNYTIGDLISRHQKMLGKNVMQPVGWDAFGLPAENAAIKNKTAPAKWTYKNIKTMSAQFKRLGIGYDWSREIATCRPEYYKWEQWFFTKLFEKGLVYKKNATVNWDPVDQTVLANEQVVNGRGWRSGALVEKKTIPQWFIKITAYADELLEYLDKLPGWPQRVKTMQRNWIGKSVGVEIKFDVENEPAPLAIFTTRPDTLLGSTYLAIAAEHPLAKKAALNNSELTKFIAECKKTSTIEADLATAEKLGMNTGLFAIHPLSGKKLPIYCANFVLMEYGSGAVMSVPGHDQRDYEFATKYNLPIAQVITPANGEPVDLKKCAFTEKGILVNSGKYDGMDYDKAFDAIAADLGDRAQKQTNYRLRDWGVSRQRYWGAPIPIINCDKCGAVAVPASDLPVVLPENVNVDGSGSPLTKMPEFYETICPKCGIAAKRETDTFDTFMESSWYYARYTSPRNDQSMLDADLANKWLPVDQYVGGIEHAVMHLLYARFYHKLLRDEGLVNSDEPFTRLLTQGMVLKDGAKMSKSKGNTVDPNALIEKYGADTARLFTIFASPPDQSLEWSDDGVDGAYRFIRKIWNFASDNEQILIDANKKPIPSNDKHKKTRHELHIILQQANFDLEKQQFNTVVAAGMKIINLLAKLPADESAYSLKHEGFSILLRLLNPVIPHITHVLWQELKFGDDIAYAAWPTEDPSALKADEITIVVQINGKMRDQIEIDVNTDRDTVEKLVLKRDNVKRHTDGKTIRKIIYVPKRLVNIVISC